MPFLEIRNLSKIYESNVKAIDQVNLSLERGEFQILCGPSGAGKSTLFKLITLEEKPSSGEILFEHWENSQIKKSEIQLWRRKMGVIFQDLKLFKERTVFENVAVSLRISGKKEKEVRRKVLEILSLVGLSSRRNFLVDNLAHGEKQKVAIARACVHDPLLILADEPTGHLDRETSEEILNLLQNFNKSGSALLLATNQTVLASALPAKLIKIKEGRLIE
jgi:cell division transport system ATP-binding protein